MVALQKKILDSGELETLEEGNYALSGTGHSLGGATLIAWLFEMQQCNPDYAPLKHGTIVTFGAPRVGKKAFTKVVDTTYSCRMYNVINNKDPVPRVPLGGNWTSEEREKWLKSIAGHGITQIVTLPTNKERQSPPACRNSTMPETTATIWGQWQEVIDIQLQIGLVGRWRTHSSKGCGLAQVLGPRGQRENSGSCQRSWGTRHPSCTSTYLTRWYGWWLARWWIEGARGFGWRELTICLMCVFHIFFPFPFSSPSTFSFLISSFWSCSLVRCRKDGGLRKSIVIPEKLERLGNK
ncbi:hypothetical protein L873DRAFT_1844792 [Choiromyces venosus 120613-1]|uniref:Fungal lipase-type domain-containing protein n=1 Tax=Choiromyces venosus 120613-1 TaxID=1336337 RepID=A0A3N4JGN9_9PEZI|nr:hypothetical protein L873DRAFT_1844792 [Choiromyces venosus 120613-1]